MDNAEIERRFAAGEDVWLLGRSGPERVRAAFWVRVRHCYAVHVDGFQPFFASESLTLQAVGEPHRWCSRIAYGTRVATTAGYRRARISFCAVATDVLHIELDGPTHEYQVEDGVWTHNAYKADLSVGP